MMVLQHASSGQQSVKAMRRKRSKGTIVAHIPKERSETVVEPLSSSTQQPETLQPPCHAARLALLCTQNAIRMGAQTHLSLCPPGRARRDLQTALRERNVRRHLHDTGSCCGLDKLTSIDYEAEEDNYLMSTNTFDDESDEEASSGDEDELCDIEEMFSDDAPSLDDDEKYASLREPLYVAVGSESALSNPNGGPLSAMGPGAPGKLPFNRRKIRYFDLVTSTDSTNARLYLRKELHRSKKRAIQQLSRQLRQVRKRRMENGESDDDADEEIDSCVEEYDHPMTTAASAALLLESLALNQVESLEGMSKCYDGIVAAGVALLDSQTIDPTSLPSADSKTRPLRSEIVAALAPLLITSLEQPGGEVILNLARMRRMCGTVRYQRRFVQRVAPFLIRPPRAAVWCLRHQNDMEAILAASELIFDSAFDVFSKGWYERGRMLLADTKRTETLKSAAEQLRNLSPEHSHGLALAFPGGHGGRRRLMAQRAGENAVTGEALAEWEVIAVDRQIRLSIFQVLSMDWSKAIIHSDIPKPHNRRATTSSATKRIAVMPQTSSSEMSPKSFAGSPRSPSRAYGIKTPSSPPHVPSSAALANRESMENAFGPLSNANGADRALSPPPPTLMPASPPPVQRVNSKEQDAIKTPMTPPRSPKSPRHTLTTDVTTRAADSTPTPISPKRGKLGLFPKEIAGPAPPIQTMTPLSPSASSVGTSGSGGGDLVAYKPTPAASAANTAAHYRMLTATAAERKRTVAACRALRAQIQRFEEAFSQLHGRYPKGNAERAPLATTYAQYREWKRAIRADAACRIQALLRGASTRWKLLRTNNPSMTRVIMRRAGRVSKGLDSNIMNQISIPMEIGQVDPERPIMPIMPSSSSDQFAVPGQNVAPQWASKVVRRRNSGDRDNLPTAAAPKPYTSIAPKPSSTSLYDVNGRSLSELQAHKRELKQQLKLYDMNFARKHGRMPVKVEKEPIRHLYEEYNALKSQISRMEHEGRHVLTPMQSPAPSQIPKRTVSPPSSESGHSGSEDSPARTSPLPARGKRKVPMSASPPMTAMSSGAPSQDLAALKAEKSQLHQMLRSYEKDFFKDHKRQVSSFADIRPVASQYRRYKEIKKAIAALQQGER